MCFVGGAVMSYYVMILYVPVYDEPIVSIFHPESYLSIEQLEGFLLTELVRL